jgi:hypothetical protein
MGAIKAFRAEELAAEDPDSGSDAKEEAPSEMPPEPGQVDAHGLPVLDATSRGLNSLSDSTFSGRAAVERPPKSLTERALPIGLAIVGLLVVIFASVKVVSAVMVYIEEKNRVPELIFHNRAPAILEAGGPAIDALRAAAEALAADNNDENRAIGSRALAAVEAEVLAQVNTTDWSMEAIRVAAALGEACARAYIHPLTARLKNMTREENILYSMVLKSIAADGKSAAFTLQNGRTVDGMRQGDVIESRFKVVRLTPVKVELEDPLRKSRAGSPRMVTFSLDNRAAH